MPTGPQFGGVGAMIEPPNVEVTIAPSKHFSVHGAHADRVRQFVETVVRNWNLSSLPDCRIEVRSPAGHTGLGVGTQLALATAAGLRRFLKLPELPIESLAASVGRGKRSAVGTYGFQHGGLIVDAGKARGEQFGKLSRREELPAGWRFVLMRSTEAQGLAGDQEAETFANLPPVPEAVTRKLWQITNEQMLPALAAADCAAFGEAVYQFGRLAGECFATAQGGPFASSQIERLVMSIRDYGVMGVGQSSWGPTVFALTENDSAAQQLANWIQDHAEYLSQNRRGLAHFAESSEQNVPSRRGLAHFAESSEQNVPVPLSVDRSGIGSKYGVSEITIARPNNSGAMIVERTP